MIPITKLGGKKREKKRHWFKLEVFSIVVLLSQGWKDVCIFAMCLIQLLCFLHVWCLVSYKSWNVDTCEAMHWLGLLCVCCFHVVSCLFPLLHEVWRDCVTCALSSKEKGLFVSIPYLMIPCFIQLADNNKCLIFRWRPKQERINQIPQSLRPQT